MLARESKNKRVNDRVFSVVAKAKYAAEKYGEDKVINATIGSLYDEDGTIVTLDSVMRAYRGLSLSEIVNYAPSITGTEEYKESVKRVVLGEKYKEKFENQFMEVIATPGGSGAISNSIKNYLNKGEKILLPNLMWDPYKLMAEEAGGGYETYRLFNEDGNFNLEDFRQKVFSLIEVQETLVIMINDPCQNPTGYKLSIGEWKGILDILKSASEKKGIILLNDIAYIDFDDRTEEEMEEYRSLFKNLPEKLLTIFQFSISKSFTSYGLRVGAQLALSTSKKVVDDFTRASSYSCRASWSNISRGGMKMFSDIVLNEEKFSALKKERADYIKLLKERAEIFLSEAEKVGLKTYPYVSGFFITLPIERDLEKVIEELEKNHIYTVALENAIRIAVCSVPKMKIHGMAERIKSITASI